MNVSKKFTVRKDNSLKERLVTTAAREHKQEFWALRDVTIEIGAGTTVGLIGANGSGKSTLLKTIGGILTPSSGYVERRGRVAALLELGAGFHGDLTGRENVYLNASILGLSRKQTDQYFGAIEDFADLQPGKIDQQVKFYSSGMYVRLAFAVAVHVDPEILLVDEVLAVGDEPFQRKCLDRIRQFQHEGRTIILVTHSLDQVRQMCDRVVLLEHGNVIIDGEPSDAVRHFREGNVEAENTVQASTEHPIEISDVRVIAGNGERRAVFDSGEALAVEFDVAAASTVTDWAAGVAIVDSSGTVVYGTNTTLQKRELDPVTGKHTVHYGFDTVPLSEGQYFVDVAVHPEHGSDYHRIDRAVNFFMHTPTPDPGFVHLLPRIEIT